MTLTLITKDKAEDYSESYDIDVDSKTLEYLLESVDGRFEIDGNIVTRLMPECIAKSKVSMFLARKWGNFYETRYADTSGTTGVSYEGGESVTPDINLFDRVNREVPPKNQSHMLLPGCPAQNWCLEVEWESEANQHNKGVDKVNRLFSYTGANNFLDTSVVCSSIRKQSIDSY
jgi:hypothetical protein